MKSTIVENFKNNYHLFDLPDKFDEHEKIDLELTTSRKTLLNKRLFEIKKKLIDSDISLFDILSLDNINLSERKKLIKLYCEKTESDTIKDYFKVKKILKKKYHFFKNKSIKELNEIRKKKLLHKTFLSLCNSKNDIDSVLNLNIPIEKKAFIIRRIKDDVNDDENGEAKTKKWLNYVLNIPFNNFIDFDKSFNTRYQILLTVKNNLDDKIYGLKDVKEKILLLLNNKLNNIENKTTNISLIGPPGIGKTTIIKILADSLNLPYKLISMAGISDNSYLMGHSFTYVGSKPGKIIESIIDMKSSNGILFFDEVDKISQTKKEVMNQLIHITDYTQNNNFSDYYIEIPVDLSKLWFFFSMNDEKLIDPVLNNRLDKIYISGYSNKEKLCILKNYIVPDLLKKFNLSCIFNDNVLEYIINLTIKEPGMRELERNINDIFKKLKLLYDIEFNNNFDLSFNFSNKIKIVDNIITTDIIDFFIKKIDIPEYIYKMYI
jgi:ATP-dependent Lon protease